MAILRVFPQIWVDSGVRRTASKSSRLLVGAAPVYPAAADNEALEILQEDQGPFGACGGHGVSQALQIAGAKQARSLPWVASPGGIYALARCLALPYLDAPLTDSGVMPSDLVSALSWGVHPYGGPVTDPDGTVRASDVTSANVNTKPDFAELEKDALEIPTGLYRVDESASDAADQCRASIATFGAIGWGFWVDRAFQAWRAGDAPLDDVDLTPGLPNTGGHWSTAMGYDTTGEGPPVYKIWNTWGREWGDNGHILVTENWRKKAVSDILVYRLLSVGGP